MHYNDYLPDEALQAYCNSINGRAAQLGNAGRITVADLRDCILSCGGYCQWCGTSLIKRDFEIDHIISLANGGSNTIENIAVACVACNRRKSSKHTAQFVREIYAETGKLTSLIQRVVDHYGIDDLTIQQSLFTSPTDENTALSSDDSDERPPYIWGKNNS